MNAYKLADLLIATFPDIDGIEAESNTKIFLGNAAEGGLINGVDACNYYSYERDPEEKIWTLGVHNELYYFLNKHNYFAECYDPGTYYAYEM